MKNKRTILLTTLSLILLAGCGGLSSKQKTAASDALAALKKIEAATQVGVNYQQYGMLVIEAKDKVNAASAVLPDGELKKELNAAIDAYADASTAWGVEFNQYSSLLRPESEPGKTLIPKYSLKTELLFPDWPLDRKPNGQVARPKDALQVIWVAARTHLERATSLLEK